MNRDKIGTHIHQCVHRMSVGLVDGVIWRGPNSSGGCVRHELEGGQFKWRGHGMN